MEFKINSSPHLKMSEITKRLFNRNFLSDVQFSVDGKIIYAHSLELMKRSVVFEQQLAETLGDKKLIPIVDYTYGSFFEFIRFIYTDECTITEDNGIEILKLATHYKVIMLENKVINFRDSVLWGLKLFEHSIVDSYELIHNLTIDIVFDDCTELLEHKQFLSLHPDAIDALLKCERIPSDVKEVNLFTALCNWIVSFCKTHQMSLSEARQRFDNLIRKIRFPTMSNEEIRECTNKFPGLLTKSDCISIAGQTVFGGGEIGNSLWISKCRDTYIDPYCCETFSGDHVFETRLSVSKDTILHGMRIGDCEGRQMKIDIFTKGNGKFSFTLAGRNIRYSGWNQTINLDDSLRLKSNCEYTITIKYLDIANSKMIVFCRKKKKGAIINDPAKSVNILLISRNMLEMCFKSPTD